MLRNFAAVVVGLVAGGLAIGAVQALSGSIYPPPEWLDPRRPGDLARVIELMPAGALWMLELSYLAGSLLSGAVAALIARSRPIVPALAIGAFFTAANIFNLVSLPHPFWIGALTTLTFLPGSWAGAALVLRRGRAR